MDPEREWTVRKLRCFVCEARASEADAVRDRGGSLDGMFFAVTEADGMDEEVMPDD